MLSYSLSYRTVSYLILSCLVSWIYSTYTVQYQSAVLWSRSWALAVQTKLQERQEELLLKLRSKLTVAMCSSSMKPILPPYSHEKSRWEIYGLCLGVPINSMDFFANKLEWVSFPSLGHCMRDHAWITWWGVCFNRARSRRSRGLESQWNWMCWILVFLCASNVYISLYIYHDQISVCVRVCVYLFLCLAICSSLFIVPIYMSIIMSIHTCWSIYGQRWHICSRLNAASSRVPAWSWASFDSAGCKMITRAETSTKCTK